MKKLMKKKSKLNKFAPYSFFPVSSPYITKKDIGSVNRVLKSGWISSDGPEVKKFEKKFSHFVGRKYSVAVSSGTAALEIAIKALNIKKDEKGRIEIDGKFKTNVSNVFAIGDVVKGPM